MKKVLTRTRKLKCLEFVEHYLECFNATEAARRLGYKGSSASTHGHELLHNEFTQAELEKRYSQHATENKNSRQIVIQMLMREANYFGDGASHSARVKAQTQLSKILGMESQREPEVVEKNRGVMLVPYFQSGEEWEKEAISSQAALKQKMSSDRE